MTNKTCNPNPAHPIPSETADSQNNDAIFFLTDEVLLWALVTLVCAIVLTSLLLTSFYLIARYHLNGRLSKLLKSKYVGRCDDVEIDIESSAGCNDSTRKEVPAIVDSQDMINDHPLPS